MRVQFLLLLLMCGAAVIGLNADQGAPARAALETARKTAVVDGDLAAAIKQYEAIVATYGKTDRPAAAQALLMIAELFTKQGDARANATYARVVREFPEQQDAAATARTRLGGTERAEVRNRQINLKTLSSGWNYTSGSVSADGRYLPYIDDSYHLSVLDLSTGTDRVLARWTGIQGGGAPGSARISKDSSQIAYSWCSSPPSGASSGIGARCDLHIASLRNSQPVRKLVENPELEIRPLDWSPDGRQIVVSIDQGADTAIGLVDVQTGALSRLRSVNWRGARKALFSPDGRQIAFDLPASDTDDARDVFVIATDASYLFSPAPHAGQDVTVGWTPGGALLFTSSRGGSIDLWAVRLSGQRAAGQPQMVSAGLKGTPIGVTTSGALFTEFWIPGFEVELASLDLAAARQTAPPTRIEERFVGANSRVAWSADGEQIAYRSAAGERTLLVIRSLKSGDVREVPIRPNLQLQGITWAPDGGSILFSGQEPPTGYGVYSLDVKTGAIAPVVVPIAPGERLSYEGFFWSPDRKYLYFHSMSGTIHERDLAAGTTRALRVGPYGPISVSPDGKWIATARYDAAGTPPKVLLIPVAGGEERELLRLDAGQDVNNVAMPWTADGTAVLVRKMLGGNKSELWVAPVGGGAPRRIEGFDASRIAEGAPGMMALHPDGRRFAFVSGTATPEVWVLENALSALK